MGCRFKFHRKGLRIASSVALLAGYIACVTQLIRVDEFVLVTRTEVIRAPAGGLRRIAATAHGRDVELFSIPGRTDKKAESYVLRFSGNARAESVVRRISERWGSERSEVWCMNYPGSGGSAGPARLENVAPAALAAFDALRREAGDRPIYLDGNSFGAAVALHVAANRQVAGLLLQNPPPIRQLVRARFRGPILWLIVWPVSFQVPQELDAIANASRCTAPAVFIHSLHDKAVPDQFQNPVLNAYAGAKRRIDVDFDHEVPLDPNDADINTAIHWLRAHAAASVHSR